MRKWLKYVLNGLAVVALLALLAFANVSQNDVVCQQIEIAIDRSNGNFFIEEEDIYAMVYHEMDTVVGRPIAKIDANHLEHKLNNHSAVQNTEVYKTIDGKLVIDVQQRTPIIRIFNIDGESYYIDSTGKAMPPSPSYTSRVLIASGNIKHSFADIVSYELNHLQDSLASTTLLDDLFSFAEFIRKDRFWNAQIEQLYVNKDSEIELIPRVGNHRIVFGDAASIRQKFEKLKVFYFKGLSKTGWNEYSVVNLKYEGQVVCTKR